MPLYEYKCQDCGNEFERLVALSDDSRNTRTCPCGGASRRQISELGSVYHPTKTQTS